MGKSYYGDYKGIPDFNIVRVEGVDNFNERKYGGFYLKKGNKFYKKTGANLQAILRQRPISLNKRTSIPVYIEDAKRYFPF